MTPGTAAGDGPVLPVLPFFWFASSAGAGGVGCSMNLVFAGCWAVAGLNPGVVLVASAARPACIINNPDIQKQTSWKILLCFFIIRPPA
jgi:hypothetical protein